MKTCGTYVKKVKDHPRIVLFASPVAEKTAIEIVHSTTFVECVEI